MQDQADVRELGKEYPAPGEDEAIEKIIDIHNEAFLQRDRKPVQRAQHPKHHGCVKAQFIVEPNLPDNVRVGLFSEPRSFPAWIRFSNSRSQDDTALDGRGMAIKLMEVDGDKVLDDEQKTQDFLLINYPVFFIRNLQDYVKFFHAVKPRPNKPLWKFVFFTVIRGMLTLGFFLPSFNPFRWRWRELRILWGTARQKIGNPLFVQYWSTTPYKLGKAAIKFSAKPSWQPLQGKPASTEHYLREAMIEHLECQEAHFDFLVQLQTDPVQMPIEDPTIEWQSPFIKVATIQIPPQIFASDAQMEFCENLSFSPWHCLPVHQPLGGINRARRLVYHRLSKRRHEFNHVVATEPHPEVG